MQMKNWALLFYLIRLDAHTVFGVGDEHGVHLDLLYLVKTSILS
jgi:hypothetical protein